VLNTSFPSWPSYSSEEAEAVSQVLLSNKVNYWTGYEVRSFEKEFASFADTQYAVALANGTLALDLALKVLDVGLGDEVIVTPRTFIASISSVVIAGATPIFADVDIDSQNINAENISEVITPKTKAIIVVHLAGMPADMDQIMELANDHNLYVIEDCAQAHGAKYKGKSVGSIGHIGAWSFCQDKIITTGGEGGMVTTNDELLWDKMWSYKDHGKSWQSVYKEDHPPGFRWVHNSFGTNWRMNEMQGVIGRIQLKRMEEWNRTRQAYAEMIWSNCSKYHWLRVPAVSTEHEHAAYKCYVFVVPAAMPEGWTRDKVIAELMNENIPAYSGTCSEVYLEKAFDNTPFRPTNRLPIAQELGETSLMFLVHPTLKEEHIQKTVDAIGAMNDKMFD